MGRVIAGIVVGFCLFQTSSAEASVAGGDVLPALQMWDMTLLLPVDQFQLRAPDLGIANGEISTFDESNSLATLIRGIELAGDPLNTNDDSAPVVLLQFRPSIAQRGLSLRCEWHF